ncbi:MAG: GNAT family N-acetyltransferase [Dissulfurispiraceae bacterium]|jgi:RimJ/RimL family protein N-acetyltransferase|nr:GNAT family N-acetyltransferase [Dissulfurispiraceae bacterium]
MDQSNKSSPIDSLKKRIKTQGFRKTLIYILFVYLLPKVGLNIKFEYRKFFNSKTQNHSVSSDVKIMFISSYDQLSEIWIKAILKHEGAYFIEKLDKVFKDGDICVVCETNMNPAGLFLLRKMKFKNEANVYFAEYGFVFPEYRGRGYFTQMLGSACCYLSEIFKDVDLTLVGNVYIGNSSSIRGFEKVGFKRISTSVYFFNKLLKKIPNKKLKL